MTAIAQQNATLTKAIQNQNERLAKKIEEFGTSAYHGRKAIWDQVNDQRDRLAAVEVHADTGIKIEKLADAIAAAANKGGEG